MRQSIGATATFNIIIIFMVIVFGLLIGTINYYKAFKVNARMLDIVDKYEGYNQHAVTEIESFLNSMGYARQTHTCNQESHGGTLVSSGNNSYDYCMYYHANDGTKNDPKGTSTYYNYSVVTYITADIFTIHLRLPVYTKGERIYRFGTK